jgi:putative ABC transport system permease protein
MLINYFKIAFRSLIKFKAYTMINLTGLALGLATGMMIMLYIMDEISFDHFHKQGSRIYRVATDFIDPKSGSSNGLSETNGWPVGSILKKDFPEVEEVAYARSAAGLLIFHDGKRFRQQMHFVSPAFTTMFSFNWLKGNANKALMEPYTMVITKSMEEKFFPDGDALNKTLMLSDTIPMVVTGVVQDVPSNSHIQFDALISFATYERLDSDFSYSDGWGNINVRNYVLLKTDADIHTLAAKAKSIYTEHASAMLKDWGTSAAVVFEPLYDIYLYSKRGNGMGPHGSIERIYLVAGIAIFVIFLACINFINLTTARSVYRSKEVGLRKVAGSTRGALIRQFLSESFLLSVIAVVFAIGIATALLPVFNELLAKPYTLMSLLQWKVVLGLVALVIIMTLLSGYYPAVLMSGMRPVEVLKGRMQSSTRGVKLRRSLVVFQFSISVVLVLGALIVMNQLKFMQQQELGFAKDEILVVNAARVQALAPQVFETFKHQMEALPGIQIVGDANGVPGTQGWSGQIAYPEGKSGESAVSVEYLAVDENYIDALGLKLLAGHGFDANRPGDFKDGLVLNETAVYRFGWSSPSDAIGKKISSPSGYPAGEVIGVIKDYHQTGLQQNIGPIVMDYNPGSSYLYTIRYKAAGTEKLLRDIQALWSKTFEGYDFNYFFLNESFERQYMSEQRLAKVFGLFAAVTILIALIGLQGLISFVVAAKTKEIGVRKVLGAHVIDITRILSKEFIVLVVIANIIAAPVAWYFADAWLTSFASRVSVTPILFLVTLILTVVVTGLAIGYQTVKAALMNPVKSLRYE